MFIEILRVLIVPLLILLGALLTYFSHIDRESLGMFLAILGAWHIFQSYRFTIKRYNKGLVIDTSTGKKRRNKILLGTVLLIAGILLCLSNFSPKIFRAIRLFFY